MKLTTGLCATRSSERKLFRLWEIMDALDTEDDDHVRARLLDEGIGIADTDDRCGAEWASYRGR